MAQDTEAQEIRYSIPGILVRVAALGTSAVAAALLAGWFGITLGDNIRHGMPWERLQPRVLTAALLLLFAVVLIMIHWRPGIIAGKDVWWEKALLAAASVTLLWVCQFSFGGIGA